MLVPEEPGLPEEELEDAGGLPPWELFDELPPLGDDVEPVGPAPWVFVRATDTTPGLRTPKFPR